MSRQESNRKYYLKHKLANLGYDIVGLTLLELEEMDREYKRQISIKRRMGELEKKSQPIGTKAGDSARNVDREFYKVVHEEGELKPRVKVPYGISPLFKGYPVGEIVDLDGKPIKPKKKDKKQPWNF